MIYLLIALGASIIGALSGLGGGIIIKPLLDALGHYDIATINLLSSFTVLSMAIASTIRHYSSKVSFEQNKTLLLAIGSIIGATLGDSLLTKAITLASSSHLIKQLQNVLLLVMLIIVLLYINFFKNKFHFIVNNKWLIAFIGIGLGFISTLLGIGGGPINVMILSLFFSMSSKEAAVNSLILILFSQASKIFNVFLHDNLLNYDLSKLIYMIPAGIIGGIIGSKLNHKQTKKSIDLAFNLVLIFTICTTLYNILI